MGRRIALIASAPGVDTLLDYAIEFCRSQDAGLDLLVLGAWDAEAEAAMERINREGIDCRYLPLGGHPASEVAAYMANRSSLIFLLAAVGDELAKTLLEKVIASSGRRLPVPLVYIEEKVNPDLKVDL